MTSPLQQLLETMSPEQRAAIQLIKLSLDCFNSKDGIGLFGGVDRYKTLAGRVEICAVQADSLPRFWALLLRRMQWPVPPKSADPNIVSALSSGNDNDVLRVLASETASVITLARMAHDQDKETRRNLRSDLGDDENFFGHEAGDLGDQA